MATSGTYGFSLSNSDLVLESFDRCQIRPTMLTGEHMTSARNSLNLGLMTFANRGVNLWAVDLQTIPLIQGVSQYALPAETVLILDAYLETYQLANLVNIAASFNTTSGSGTITVNQMAHGLIPGQWVNFQTTVSVGGVILYGFYQVATVLTANSYTIIAATLASSTVTSGGAVATYTTTAFSSTVTATLVNHGLSINQTFNVVLAVVGGLTLTGVYTITSVPTANTFAFSAVGNASSNQTVADNGALVRIAEQSATTQPFDRIMKPISRTDWAMLPNKTVQAPPTVYWFDKITPPVVNIWQVPDGNGPYTFKYYRMRRLQDAAITMGQTADVPFRFTDALCADLAMRLAQKYAPTLWESLKMDAKEAWHEAWLADREHVDLNLTPDLSGYYRDL